MPGKIAGSRTLRSITECKDLSGKRVLLRTGLDVPITPDGKVADDFRLRKSLQTINFVRAAGAKLILVGHTSRADGDSSGSLEDVCKQLRSYVPVTWGGGVLGAAVEEKIAALRDGDLLMLENLRTVEGEKGNDTKFAKTLASYADIYVNDAFSVSHREHASIVGVPQYLPSYAGEQFMDEIKHLSLARTPKAPSLFVLGGAKFETKLPLVEALIGNYTKVFIGGALANNFFKMRGYETGKSLVSKIELQNSILFDNPKLLLPIDVTVLSENGPEVKKPDQVLPNESILDAGPETIEMLKEEMRFAETILWNGPLGDYERGFDAQTRAFADIVSHAHGVTIVGGGDTVASIPDKTITDRFTFMSTAGGAMLAYLEKGTLPGIDALLASPE